MATGQPGYANYSHHIMLVCTWGYCLVGAHSTKVSKEYQAFISTEYLPPLGDIQSVIISREGLILTLSILPCPQGRIF